MNARRRLLFPVLDALALIAVGAAAYVWLIRPIDAEPRFFDIHWSNPIRPLRIAGGLLVLRLLLTVAERGSERARGAVLGVLARRYVWIPIVLLALVAWPASHYRAYRNLVRAVEAARDSGRAQIGLATRPVLSGSEMREGVELPPGSAGRTIEVACGLPAEAANFLDVRRAPFRGRILSGTDPLEEIGTCDLQAGSWRGVRVGLPASARRGDRLIVTMADGVPGRVARLALWSAPRLRPEPDGSKPNLVVISLDTLRADHLGCYAYARPTSPQIDRLAREGTLFEDVIAQSPWTTPSHMSLFTSLFPSVHGVDSPTSARQRRLPADRRLLAEILHQNGYACAAFTGSGAISAVYGFWRGFDVYGETEMEKPAPYGEDIAEVFEKASRWLVDHHDVPFFLFFHSYEVHAPYVHQTFLGEVRGASETERLTALYDGDILAADGFIGELVGLLDRLQIRDRTIVVFLSDHGEELAPRYPGRRLAHGHTQYEELLRVPLIVSAPGRAPVGLRVNEPVRLVDVMPTVLEMLGIAVPSGLQGRSLVPLLRGGSPAEADLFAEATNYGPERKTLRSGRLKYIKVFPRAEKPEFDIPVPVPDEELFDLGSDPGEARNILSRDGPELERLRQRLQAIVERNRSLRGAVEAQELDPETIDRLKALGYLR